MTFPETASRTVITASRGWRALDLRELWNYRELVYFLIWRDVKVRYKQTILGATWAVLQPLMGMVVFSILFGRLAGMPSDGVPYPVFSLAALVPWTFFANGISQAANSVAGSQNLITKVYFPRVAIPTAAVLAGSVDLMLSLLILFGVMLFYGMTPGLDMVKLPGFIVLATVTALGAGLWLSALNVRYRDVRYTVPFLVQFWLFITPVVYPISLLPEAWQPFYALNPMAGVVGGFRDVLLGTGSLPPRLLWTSAATAVLLLVSGALYFRRVENTFADII